MSRVYELGSSLNLVWWVGLYIQSTLSVEDGVFPN